MYYRIKQCMLLLGDLASLYGGLFLSLAIRYNTWPAEQFTYLLSPMTIVFTGAIVLLFILGLYDITKLENSPLFFRKIITSSVVWTIVSVIFFYLNPSVKHTPKTILLLAAVICFGLIALWRYLYNRFLSRKFLSTGVVFAGFTEDNLEVIQALKNEPHRGYTILGFLVNETAAIPAELGSMNQAATLKELTLKNTGRYPDIIVLNERSSTNPEQLNDLYQALFKQTSIMSLAEFYEESFGRVPPFAYSESWFITNLREQEKKIYDRFRSLIEYSAGILLTFVFVLSYPFVALITKLTSPGPVLFKQTRVGRNGKNFTIYKYRTMHALSASGSAEVGGPQFAQTNDTRVTTFGKILRKTHVDEIPQCLNMLRGEMALIGPRPERPEFFAELSKRVPYYTLRSLVKPGLTGWAQLQKSYYDSLDDNLFKLQYDLYYVKHRGVLLDISIALKTLALIVGMRGR